MRIRTTNVDVAAADLRAALVQRPDIDVELCLLDGWRIGARKVTDYDGTVYVGHVVAVRGDEVRLFGDEPTHDFTGDTMARLRRERDAWRELTMALLRETRDQERADAKRHAQQRLLDLGIDPYTGKRL
jgi:hypothetical protein